MIKGSGYWTYDASASAWYFGFNERTDPPLRDSVFVEARVDLDAEGRVAGIELLDPRLLPPTRALEKK
jgi:uncharacterized protein YuzE